MDESPYILYTALVSLFDGHRDVVFAPIFGFVLLCFMNSSPLPFGHICFMVLVIRKGGESS